MVSVIMSVFNETEKELRIAVESILNQTYQDIELIIVLDNPENILLKNILLDYQRYSGKVILTINEKNIGLAESLNKAFRLSKGVFIARMDADDISHKKRIERQVRFMEENKEYAVVGTNREDIDEEGCVIRRERKVITDYRNVAKILKYGSPLSHPSIMIRREVFQKLDGYRTFRSAQDYDLYLRCLLAGYHITNLNEILLQYRIRKNSISAQNAYLQMLTKDYAQKLYRRAKRKKKNHNDYSESEFEKFCEKKGLYNKKKVSDYIELQYTIKTRRLRKLIWIVFRNPEFSIYIIRAVIFFNMQNKYGISAERYDNTF